MSTLLASSVAQLSFISMTSVVLASSYAPWKLKSMVQAFVTSRVDYCNSLLYGLPASQLNKVQRVLNTAARLVYCAPLISHIIPLMHELHWLPFK